MYNDITQGTALLYQLAALLRCVRRDASSLAACLVCSAKYFSWTYCTKSDVGLKCHKNIVQIAPMYTQKSALLTPKSGNLHSKYCPFDLKIAPIYTQKLPC